MSFENPGDGKLCDHCDRPGQPYEHHGQTYPGLFDCEGERLCPDCLQRAADTHAKAPVGWAQVPASEYITPRWR